MDGRTVDRIRRNTGESGSHAVEIPVEGASGGVHSSAGKPVQRCRLVMMALALVGKGSQGHNKWSDSRCIRKAKPG